MENNLNWVENVQLGEESYSKRRSQLGGGLASGCHTEVSGPHPATLSSPWSISEGRVWQVGGFHVLEILL